MLRTLALLMGAFSGAVLSNTPQHVELTLNISGTKGNAPIHVSFYDAEESFLDSNQARFTRVLPVDESGHYRLAGIEAGDYALTLFQDTKTNGKLDHYFFGPPKEPAGFSNNPKIWIGPPSYDECRVTLKADTALTIELK